MEKFQCNGHCISESIQYVTMKEENPMCVCWGRLFPVQLKVY